MKNFKNLLGNKGISPVIATVLLLTMTIGAAGSAYFWMSELQQSLQLDIAKSSALFGENSGITLSVAQAICDSTATSSEVKIFVQNIGTTVLKSGGIGLVVSDSSQALVGDFEQNSTALSSSLQVNSFLEINFDLNNGVLVSGSTYGLSLNFPTGYSLTTSCKAT